MRSLTPGSADGVNGNGTRDALGSPLAKRKKVAADRTGHSKLKEAIAAADLQSGPAVGESSKSPSVDGVGENERSPGSKASDEGMEEDDGDDDEEEDGVDDDDDFLARELEEEWG